MLSKMLIPGSEPGLITIGITNSYEYIVKEGIAYRI